MDIFGNKKMVKEIKSLQFQNKTISNHVEHLNSKVNKLEDDLNRQILKLKRNAYYEIRLLRKGFVIFDSEISSLFYDSEEKAIAALIGSGERGIVLFRGRLEYYVLKEGGTLVEASGGIPEEAIYLYERTKM